MFEQGKEPYTQIKKLEFRCYYPHEVEKLSVLNVTETKTFDEVGHPIRGGLYDPRLGPIETGDMCETCYQRGAFCPGHFGHIKVDLALFSPMLFSFTFSLMKGSCVQCHRLTCNSYGLHAKLLLAQLRALELGMVSVAQELEEYVRDRFDVQSTQLFQDGMEVPHMSDEASACSELDNFFNSLCAKMDHGTADILSKPVKNAVEIKRTLIGNFCRNHVFKRRQRCPLCKSSNGMLRNDGGRCILIDFSGSKVNKRYKLIKKIDPLLQSLDPENMEVENGMEMDDSKEPEIDSKSVEYGSLANSGERILREQMTHISNGTCDKLAWRGLEVREHLRMVWAHDGHLLKKIFPLFCSEDGKHCPVDILFCETVLVPPTKYRPVRIFKGDKFENPQTLNLRKLLEATETIRALRLAMDGNKGKELMNLVSDRVYGKTIPEKMHNAYLGLQQRLCAIFDQDLDKTTEQRLRVPGIKQILEKKQGLFRMNMMGKRVNFACRSVITPDPYLNVDEIGIPEVFAKKLTVTEPVNALNITKLRKLVTRGPQNHPGANFVRRLGGNVQILNADKKSERNAIAKGLQPGDTERLSYPVQVLRHLNNGDHMLMNRQPSLHKPSIMGHRVRVLRGQKALRMNYAPCKAYNADFDGDEMNGHFVQNYIAQTEIAEIANVGCNFLVPKDGTPLLGLIQDHVVSGVMLTIRGRFFSKEDFMHLVFSAFAETHKRIDMPPPAMIKPKILWSGKQIISTILRNCIPDSKPLINLSSKAKTPLTCWQVANHSMPIFDMSESEVIFRKGELLVGVLDKQHYGSTQYGLIHCCWDLYGQKCAMMILSCFSRLFTTFLQLHGFTLGVADILVNKEADKERKKVISALRKCGDDVVKDCFFLDKEASKQEIKHVLASAYCNPKGGQENIQQLDYKMKEVLNKYNEKINSICVPLGLVRSFPHNALQLMILSGAKGTMVNAVQISCELGQIELEGHRPPMTIAGRTLPSFRAFDTSPRAGGFVDQRFLTGINPQELFFHTMAGREGLIDTAVKTSRSGYLQRCIVKHLEGLVVNYDSTVRDHDGSIIQFRYGEDGMDVCKSTFLKPNQFDFLADNLKALRLRVVPADVTDSEWGLSKCDKAYKKIKKWRKKYGDQERKNRYSSGFVEFSKEYIGVNKQEIVKKWFDLSDEERCAYHKRASMECPPMKMDPNYSLGALPQKLLDEIDSYIQKENNHLKNVPMETFRKSVFWKGMRCRVDPGENVGLLAAQSIGEPSTQMTLNTFHFAGRGEMNVTLGIPRLREILMTGSKNIKTPSAEIRMKPNTPAERIENIKRELSRVYLKQLIKKFTINERINLSEKESWRCYDLCIELLRANARDESVRHVSRSKILTEIELRFVKAISKRISNRCKEMVEYQAIQHKKLKAGNISAGINAEDMDLKKNENDDGASSDEEVSGDIDTDAAQSRLLQRHQDDAAEYEGEEDEKKDIKPNEEFDVFSEDSEAEDVSGMGDAMEDDKIDFATKFTSAKADNTRIQLPLSTKTRLDISALVERELENFVVSETPGVEKCILMEENRNGQACNILATQGINVQALFKHSDVLDVNSLYSNDLNMIYNNYGIEACAQALLKEIKRVFKPYGIDVDNRHLTLTTDYVTFTGCIQPFSRGAMAFSASPLQKMTFETTVSFMRDAIIHGDIDHVESPSAKIVVGGLLHGGTGMFDLMVPAKHAIGLEK